MSKLIGSPGYRLFVGVGNGPVLQRSLNVRDDVFVRELQYEPTARSKGDEHSLHFVISMLSPENEPPLDLGSARLVLSNGKPKYRFPCEEVYAASGLKSSFNQMAVPQQSSETSRLVVLQQYRHTEIGAIQQTRFADMLMFATMRAASMVGLAGGYVLITHNLAEHVERDFGLTLEPAASTSVEHRGTRHCFWVQSDPAAHKMTPYAQALFDWADRELQPHEKDILAAPAVRRLNLTPRTIMPKVA